MGRNSPVRAAALAIISRRGEWRVRTVVAVDPGKMTGVALVRVTSIIKHYGFEFPEDAAVDYYLDEIPVVLHNPLSDEGVEVVCESIIISTATAKKSQDVQASIRQIGVLQHLCRRKGIKFTLQPPSDQAFGTDELLRALGWWTVGSDHARSASRHAAKYLAQTDPEFRQLAVEILP